MKTKIWLFLFLNMLSLSAGELSVSNLAIKPLPGLTKPLLWVTVTYTGPATNHWTMQLRAKEKVDAAPYVVVEESNYIDYTGAPFNTMVWALPYNPTNAAAFFDIELLEEE